MLLAIPFNPLTANIFSVIAKTITVPHAKMKSEKVGSCNGKRAFNVIGGKNEYILVCRGVFLSMGWAGRLIKSLNEMTSILLLENI